MRVHALAAPKPAAPLEPFEYDTEVGAGEVLIKVSHCGICHSDVHLVDGNWGQDGFPLVPGHEVVGTVEEAGTGVAGLEPGDRVGLGWQCGACHHCDHRVRGEQNLCRQNRATARSHGGFADLVKADAPLVFSIPDALDSAGAAPLLCGGVTMFAPVRRHARPGDRVGIVGLGGLGHLGVQWANRMGCHVTVFSGSPDKEEEARDLGANAFLNGRDAEAVAAAECDLIVSTVHADLDWNNYLRALRPNGTLCFVGVPPSPLSIHAGSLLGGQKSVTASAIGGAASIRQMLAFAALHGVEAVVEKVPMQDADRALDRTRQGKARYRMVLEA